MRKVCTTTRSIFGLWAVYSTNLQLGEKPFRNDFDTLDYKTSKRTLSLVFDSGFNVQCKGPITTCIETMLHLNWRARPSATDLLVSFSQHFEATEHLPDPHLQNQHRFPIIRLPGEPTAQHMRESEGEVERDASVKDLSKPAEVECK